MKNKKTKNLMYIFIGAVLVTLMAGTFFVRQSVLSVSTVNIDPQGYEDQTTHEWRGSFWSVVMTTDFDEQICAMMLQNEEGTPEDTFAVTGNYDGVSDKKYATSTSVGGNILIPTTQVMVHITPGQPYYERPLEIQTGYYTKKTYSTGATLGSAKYQRTDTYTDAIPFVHYSFSAEGGGNWVLHTPFTVSVYKNGVLVGTSEIDTTGGSQSYTIPINPIGNEYVILTDLGKLDTSGYGEPQWDNILYFDSEHIYVKSVTADNLLKYDAGQTGTEVTFYEITAECFNKFWFGTMRWNTDKTPAAVKNEILYPLLENGDYPGWVRADAFGEWIVNPIQPKVYDNILPYIESKGVQKVATPTGFSYLEKTSDNKLRVYFDYGTKSSLITVKISTELADTIVWQPQVANFEITSFTDFGDVVDTATSTITVKCLEGSGSAQLAFTKSPSDIPVSITPLIGVPTLTAGETYTTNVVVQNLGTETTRDFTITASVKNSLGSVTDTDSASGTLLQKTGASSVVHVVTTFEDKPISNLPVTIEYSGTSQTSTTGIGGLGTATFNLGTSADVTVTASFAGNGYYKPVSKTLFVEGATEKTITLVLSTENNEFPLPEEGTDWGLILGSAAVGLVAVMFVVMWRRTRKRR